MAVNCAEHVLSLRKLTLGAAYLDTLMVRDDLVLVYIESKRLAEAETLGIDVKDDESESSVLKLCVWCLCVG
jgi:hypothetical protein